MKVVTLTEDVFKNCCRQLADIIYEDGFSYDCMVGIANGGVICRTRDGRWGWRPIVLCETATPHNRIEKQGSTEDYMQTSIDYEQQA